MRDEIASLVFPVIRAAIEIKQGLQAYPKNFEFAKCHAKLLGLLQEPVPQDDIKREFAGEQSQQPSQGATANPNPNAFLGIRYALACWLDEIFIRDDSPCRTLFSNNTIEIAMFQTRNRFLGFWDQAERARNRSSRFARDTLEVYYLCVMLGFRGKQIDLAAWRETAEAQVLEVQDYTPPVGPKPPPEVPPLVGEASMQRWLFALTLVGLAYIPVLVSHLTLYIGR